MSERDAHAMEHSRVAQDFRSRIVSFAGSRRCLNATAVRRVRWVPRVTAANEGQEVRPAPRVLAANEGYRARGDCRDDAGKRASRENAVCKASPVPGIETMP